MVRHKARHPQSLQAPGFSAAWRDDGPRAAHGDDDGEDEQQHLSLQQLWALADRDDPAEERGAAARRPKRRAPPASQQRTSTKASNSDRRDDVDCLAELLFTSACAAEDLPPGAELSVEVAPVAGGGAPASECVLSVHASSTPGGAVPDVQVLLPLPSAAVGAAVIRLLDWGRLALCLRPARHPEEVLMAAAEQHEQQLQQRHAAATAAAAAANGGEGDGNGDGDDDDGAGAWLEPALLLSPCLLPGAPAASTATVAAAPGGPGGGAAGGAAGDVRPLPAAGDSAAGSVSGGAGARAWRLEAAVGRDAARLVSLQGVDVVLPLPPAPPSHTQDTPTGSPAASHSSRRRQQQHHHQPGLAPSDSKPWACARALSSRLSAMIAPPPPTPPEQQQQQAPAAGGAGAGGGTAAAPLTQADAVLLPGARDAIWSLAVLLGPTLLPRQLSDDGGGGGGGDAQTQAHGGQGLVDPDPESDERNAWQDDLLCALSWLLPHRAAALHLPAAAAAARWHSLHHPPPPASGPSPHAGLKGAREGEGAFSASWLYAAVKPGGGEPQHSGEVRAELAILWSLSTTSICSCHEDMLSDPVGSNAMQNQSRRKHMHAGGGACADAAAVPAQGAALDAGEGAARGGSGAGRRAAGGRAGRSGGGRRRRRAAAAPAVAARGDAGRPQVLPQPVQRAGAAPGAAPGPRVVGPSMLLPQCEARSARGRRVMRWRALPPVRVRCV